jgi:hypothetical protein
LPDTNIIYNSPGCILTEARDGSIYSVISTQLSKYSTVKSRITKLDANGNLSHRVEIKITDGDIIANRKTSLREFCIGKAPEIFSNNLNSTIEKTASLQIKISPNPVMDHFRLTIRSSKAQRLQMLITDINGKTIKNNSVYLATGENIKIEDVSALSKGIYLLQLQTEDWNETLKFFKN